MATLAVVVGLRRLRLPLILAFLIVGMCVGPHALGWVSATETTETLAEFGVVFLLFTLGLEFSLPRLIAMRGEVFTLGGFQVAGTTAAIAAIGWTVGLSLPVAILLGGAVAMSSTAIVLRQLTEQDELNRTHGRLAFGVLLFQDLAIVPFLALAGVLASPQEQYTTLEIALTIGKAAIALLIVLASGRWLLRPLFHEIAANNAPPATKVKAVAAIGDSQRASRDGTSRRTSVNVVTPAPSSVRPYRVAKAISPPSSDPSFRRRSDVPESKATSDHY